MILAPTLTLSAGSGAAIVRPTFSRDFAGERTLNNGTGPAITFTRASNATFFDASGTLRMAPHNLLLRSEEFDNAAWSKTNSSVTSNATAAPDGSSSADKLVENTSTTIHRALQQVTTSATATSTGSVFVKAAERTQVNVALIESTGSHFYQAVFDLSSQSISAGGSGTFSNTATSITNVGGGWYRCQISASFGSGTAVRLAIDTAASGSAVTTGDGTSGLFIWGAQLTSGAQAGEYFRTTDAASSMPRFDHDPATAGNPSRGLLIEEARTNLLLRSEQFDNASWPKGDCTVTANAATSPDGTVDADIAIPSTSNVATHRVTQVGGSVTAGSTMTASVYLKASGYNFVLLRCANSLETLAFQVGLNVSNGTISTAATAYGTGATVASAEIVAVGNGWYRASVTGAISALTTYGMFIYVYNASGAPSFAGDGTSGVLLWGAQLEAGAFPTSYIPTTTAAATRSADSAVVTPISGFYNQAEGTLFAEFVQTFSQAGNKAVVSLDANSASNQALLLTEQSPDKVRLFVDSGGSTQANVNAGNITLGSVTKQAAAIAANDFSMSVNGASVVSDTAGSVPSGLTHLRAGSSPLLGYNGHIRKIAYYPKRLSNTLLQQLTT